MRLKLGNACKGVSEARLDEFESEHKVKLPDDYRTFLKATNGGTPAEPGVVFGAKRRLIEYFLPLLEGKDSVWEEADVESVILLQDGLVYTGREYGVDLVPIAYLSGGDLVCLDCAKSPPEIVEFQHDVRPGGTHKVAKVAKTFTAFLRSLKAAEVEEEEVELEPFINAQRTLAGVPVVVQYGPVAPEYREEFSKLVNFDLPGEIWTFLNEYNGFRPLGRLGFQSPSSEEYLQVFPAAISTSRRPPEQPDLVNSQMLGTEYIGLPHAILRFGAGVRTDLPRYDLFRLIRCESGNWVGIDTREEHRGEVVLIRVENCENYKPAYEVLASSFNEFLKMLRAA